MLFRELLIFIMVSAMRKTTGNNYVGMSLKNVVLLKPNFQDLKLVILKVILLKLVIRFFSF